jgi:amino acid adenylation domain-containing protein/non-ribosomal peptide synthase protein (TIGR01720 family)
MSSELEARIAALPPEKRKLLERRLAEAGLSEARRAEGRRRGAEAARAIPRRADGPGPWPLSYGQRRLWFIDRLNPGTPAYNIPFAGRMAGPLRADRLARSLAEVIRRHHVLRSRFVEHDGRPAQVIDPPPPPRLPLVDLSGLPEPARHAEADRLTAADPQVPFDLARGPVVRMTLLRLEDALHDLLVTMPHIVTDAWSMAILFRELPAIHDADRQGRASPLPDPPMQVADFALWERERLDGVADGDEGRMAEELAFWREHLEGAPTVLELPTDRPRPPVQSMRGVRRAVSVPAATRRRLEALADREGATPFMALLASFAAALARWTGQDDLLLASPLATRSALEVQGLIGFFIDNAVLRADLRPGDRGEPSYRELLGRVKGSALATFAHQGVPFEKVAEAVGAGGDLSRPPLAQVNFVLQNVHIPAPEFEELSLVRAQQTDTRSSRFDLALGLFEAGDDAPERSLDGWFEYATDLFDATTIARLERDWLDLLDAALDRPEVPLSALPPLAPAARQQMLVEWNDRPSVPAAGGFDPWDATVDELVSGWAARAPDAVAVEEVDDGRTRAITYGALDRRAAALAARLRRQLGCEPTAGESEPRIALALGRSPELLVAALAVWRIGGCIVSVDPSHPEERRALILDDARPVVVIGLGPDGSLELERVEDDCSGEETAPLRGSVRGDRLAYILYTSGSTGEPKGVAVPHRAVVRLARGGSFEGMGTGRRGFSPEGGAPVVLPLVPASFDASVFGLWVPLAGGGRVALLPEGTPAVDALAEAVVRVRPSSAVLPAGLFHLLAEQRPDAFRGVSRLWIGGEALSPVLAGRVAETCPGVAVHNSYGPTENGVFTTVHDGAIDPGRATVPLGRPVAGTRVLVVDRELRPVPLGAAGELVAGGAGLARGYHRRPGGTAERFTPDPFAGPEVPGVRLYRTGDLARWLPDGSLDFLGRADRQVKVRGYRVEPGEVEAALRAHPEVAAAAVVLRDGRLAAYVVGREGEGPEPSALRSFLAGRLPDFMVPAVVVPLDALPLTPRGKLDRAALPDPGGVLERAAGGGEASDRVEEVLLAVWREVLGIERLGVHDRFFDLGGDSILAIRAIARAAEEGIELEPRQLFEHPTVAALAEVVRQKGGGGVEERGPVTGPVTLGPAQRFFFDHLAPPVPQHWNLAVALETAEGWGLDRVSAALDRVLERHDMLRARFSRDETGQWRQEVAPPQAGLGARRISAVDLSGLPPARALSAVEAAAGQVQGSLDLTAGGLVRLVRFDLPEITGPGLLLLVAHHLVTDAVSLQVILGDLGRVLSGALLGPRGASYLEWTASLEAWITSPAADAERDRVKELAAAVAGTAAGHRSVEADAESVEETLSEDDTRTLLEEAGERLRASPEEVVLAAVASALSEAAGSAARLRIDVEGHGRALPPSAPAAALDLSRTVGWFTAVRPVTIDPAASPARLLRKVKDDLRASPDGGVGHAAARWLDPRAPALPEADLSFNYLGRIELPEGGPFRLLAGAEVATGPLRHPASPRPAALELTGWIRDGRLRTLWTYDPGPLRRGEVERLAARALAAVRLLLGAGIEADAPALEEAVAASDFPHAGLDAGSLGRLLGKLGEGS